MALPKLSPLVAIAAAAAAALIFGIAISAVQAKPLAPSPGPAPAPGDSSSDGTTLDEGIAYLLMLLALVLTYLIHNADVPGF